MGEHDAFKDRERALENEYFLRKDRELIEKMRRAAAAEEARDEMGRKTGLADPALLQELQDLGFTPDTVVLLPLMPILEMGWAENEITAAERDLIIRFARGRGVEDGDAADTQLTRLMAERPDPSVFERASRLIAAMLASPAEGIGRGVSADDLVAYCEKIAAASGGMLGSRIASISKEERALLSRIAADLKGRQSQV